MRNMEAWLNRNFLEDLIRRNFPEETSVAVNDFHFKPAVSAGSNYQGNLYRITVEYSTGNSGAKTLHLIAKALPESPILLKFMSEVRAFEKEDHFYRETLHRMQEVQDIVPRSYQSSEPTIILEDLAEQGFKMCDRLKGLDLQHLRLVVRAMARFHASSAALYLQDPGSMKAYGESLFPGVDKQGLMGNYFHNQIKMLAEEMGRWPGYEKNGAKLKSILPTAMSRMCEVVKPKPGSFLALNHSDLWISNLLFHYDAETGQVDKVKFIDFQALRLASPALDFQFFLCTSCNDETRVKCIPTLVQEYHDQMSASLRKLGLDPDLYTLKQFKQDLEETKDFGFLWTCVELSGMLTEDGGEEDPVNVFNFEKAIASKRFREVFCSLIPHFESQGLL